MNAEINFGISASGVSAISARGIHGEFLNRSTDVEAVGISKINKVRTALVIVVLINIGSASTDDGVHLIHAA